MQEMARNAVKWPVTASGRRKVFSDVGRSTGDASDRRRGPAAGAHGPGAPTPNTPSVRSSYYDSVVAHYILIWLLALSLWGAMAF